MPKVERKPAEVVKECLFEFLNLIVNTVPGAYRVTKVSVVDEIEGSEGAAVILSHMDATCEIEVTKEILTCGWMKVLSFLAHEVAHSSFGAMVWVSDPSNTSGGLPEEEVDQAKPVFSRSFEEKMEERACVILDHVTLKVLEKYDELRTTGEMLDSAVNKLYC